MLKHALTTCVILLSICGGLAAAEKEKLSEIRPLLGQGFGNIIEIEGRMMYEETGRTKAWRKKKRMQVHKVGDQKLKKPVMITLETFSFARTLLPANGTLVHLRGYEIGRFGGIPRKAFADIPQVATTGFHFEHVFQVTKLIKSEQPQKQAVNFRPAI